jgi:hypothetical protein
MPGFLVILIVLGGYRFPWKYINSHGCTGHTSSF